MCIYIHTYNVYTYIYCIGQFFPFEKKWPVFVSVCAIHCNTLQHNLPASSCSALCNIQKHTATHTATKLKHNATQCHRYIGSSHGRVDERLHLTLQQTVTLCSTLQHILQRIRSVFSLTCRCNSCTLHLNTLQHTVAHCNTYTGGLPMDL